MMIIGIDTGGTFTDFVFKQGDRWGVYKVLSSPLNPAEAVLKGLERITGDRTRKIVHGSTVATNAILERKGAKTALITNQGFEDIIEIGRQNRTRLYDLAYRKEPQLVPSGLRFGIKGRTLHTGEEAEPLDLSGVEAISRAIKEFRVESVAICFLFSHANPIHEKTIGALLRKTCNHVYLSHEVLCEFREFERTSTTVINAYVSPRMQTYMGSLTKNLKKGDTISMMQSNGGRISPEVAMNESVRTILSGPAAGAIGAFEVGRAAGYEHLITLDMGGTSTDVSLIDGGLSLTTETNISGYPVKVPMIDIHTVGAGGGSIVRLDSGGSLRVGPESAGADPGPICYGKGGQITVTDANLWLGRLVPEYFLGGEMRLQKERLNAYFERVAADVGLSCLDLAEGILSVINAEMEKAIRVISVERGYDAREFTLFAFGGAGGMHAAFLARLLNIPKVLLPANAGTLSAMGMLMADIIKDYSLTVMKNQRNTTEEHLLEQFVVLEEKGNRDIRAEGIGADKLILERYLDMRYEGQSYEIMVPFEGDYINSFHRLHQKTYGYQSKDTGVEIVNLRLRAVGKPDKPQLEKMKPCGEQPLEGAFMGEGQVVFDHDKLKTRIMDRDKLLSGNRITGPAIVIDYSSTIVIPPFAGAHVDAYGNLILEIME